MGPDVWAGLWDAVQGQHIEQVVLWPSLLLSEREACGLSVQTDTADNAERFALESIKRAVRSTVTPSKNVAVSQLKCVLDARCWEVADYPDSPY